MSAFRAPWNRVLGAESHVRALRVLERTREPMSARELARRCQIQHRAVLLAVERLEAAGVVERVGSGPNRQIQLRRDHPLVPALATLFRAEQERAERVLEGLREAARAQRHVAEAVWLEGPVATATDEPGAPLVVGVLAPSAEIARVVDVLRAAMVDLMRREDVVVEVRGWTRADLTALADERRVALATAIPLLSGIPQLVPGPGRATRGKPRSHEDADQALLDEARHVAAALTRQPELIAEARAEIARRLPNAQSQEAKTLREWEHVLGGLSAARLRRWLLEPGEQAARLRQSMPVAFLRAAGRHRARRDRSSR